MAVAADSEFGLLCTRGRGIANGKTKRMCEMLGRNSQSERLAYEFGLCQPPGPCCCDIVGELMLVCKEGEPARSDASSLWNLAWCDRKPPHSDVGDGGSRSDSPSRYSSTASTRGAGSTVQAEFRYCTAEPRALSAVEPPCRVGLSRMAEASDGTDARRDARRRGNCRSGAI